MNRQDWEKQIFASNMNTTARIIALVYGSFGNWNDEDRDIWPSQTTVAQMSGCSKDTVGKYTAALVEQGWLTHIRTLERNVKVYRLTEAVSEPVGILVVPTRGKTKQQFTAVSDTDTETVSDRVGPVSDRTGSQFPTEHGAVSEPVGRNLKEPTTSNLEEPTTTESPVSDEPVASPNLEDNRLEKVEESLETFEVSETLPPSLNSKEQDRAKEDRVKQGQKELMLMNVKAKKEFMDLANREGATEEQIFLAAYLLGTSRAAGWSWYEKCHDALTQVGVEISRWAV